MYTWGSSPQALRLANQIRRRANAKQKLEENQQRELLSKRLEETLLPAPSNNSVLVEPSTSYAAVVAGAIPKSSGETKESAQDEALPSDATENIAVINNNVEPMPAASANANAQPVFPEIDPTEHLKPHLVDTSEVAGKILQVDS